MFLQMLKMVAQSIGFTSSPQREIRIRASRVFKFSLLRKWLLIVFCLENLLSQIAILDGMSIIFYQSCIILGQFVCYSKLCPLMHQTSNIILFSHFCQSVSMKSLTHVTFFFGVLKLQQYLLSHNSIFMIQSL